MNLIGHVLVKGKPSKKKLRDEFAPYVNSGDESGKTHELYLMDWLMVVY